jgi:DNA segregation ATPase FtsK/SpoIIIE, S-DNA-T family
MQDTHSQVAQSAGALPGKIEFNRPPRMRSGLSQIRVEVPSAPATPHKPASSLAGGLIIPIITVAAMSGVFLVASGSADPGQRGLMLLAGAGLLIGSALAPAWAFFEDRRRFRRQIARQQDEYGRRLRNLEPELGALREEEYRLRLGDDPAADVLLERARTRDRRLWERRPQDGDFLAVRLGLGPAASVLEVAHREEITSEPDETSPRVAQLAALRRQAAQLAEQQRNIADVPIRADLKAVGALAIVGSRPQTSSVVRAVLCQLASLHSPDDLQIAAVLGEDSVVDWVWLKWLPHVRPGRLGDAPPLVAWNTAGRAELSRWLLDELNARKRVLAEVTAYDAAQVNLSWLVVFVDDVSGLRADPALKLALAEGRKLRVAIICTTDDSGRVPGACGGIALLDPRPDGLLSYVLTAPGSSSPSPGAQKPTVCLPDGVAPAAAEAIARALAPIVVTQDAARDQGLDIPARISFFESLDVPSVEHIDVASAWELGAPSSLLRVSLGPRAGGAVLTLDLKEQGQGGHGPHGLVAGTTGAGKSELLRTMIAGLALRHPPDVLTFVLIDYKGGEAFKAVADLPHTVALITDLDRHLAQRALQTLRSELKRRERRMLDVRSTGVGSLAEYQTRRSLAGPMPFLAIIVDEFARLKDELPEFISGLIDVARVGRSLGVHLILATQTPSGTVDDQIQKNTSFALCLRVRDQSDSRHVIGEPDAALLPGNLPGRAYFRSGLDPVQLFQTANAGAPYRAKDLNEPLTVQPCPPEARPQPGLGGGNRSVAFDHAEEATEARTELDALVDWLRAAAETQGTVAPRWPDPLPETVALVGLDGADGILAGPPATAAWRWSSPPAEADWLVGRVGLVDEPSHQAQHPYWLDASRNCIVYGAAGSGKSTLLRTFAASLALSHAPQDLAMYCLDFGARTLVPLAGLPHVGDDGVFFPRDTVRIRRLFRQLEHEISRRREAGVTNLKQQRVSGSTFGATFPFMLVLLDNYAAFRETFEEQEEQTRSGENIVGDLATLMRDGPAAGIHFVVTATVPGSIHTSVVSGAETRVTLRQIDPSDYTIAGRFEQPPVRVPPGRGFATGIPPREFQVALLPDDFDDLSEQPWASGELFRRLRAAAGNFKPLGVQDLPTWLPLDDGRLRADTRGTGKGLPVVLGLDDETSSALRIDLDEVQHLVVAGPPGAGKTSLLASCLSQLLESPAAAEACCFLVLPRPSLLSRLAVDADARWQRVARNVLQLGELLDELEAIVDERREAFRGESYAELPPPPALVLLLDDYELLRQDDDFLDVEMRLTRVARRGSSVGLHMLLGGSNVELRSAHDDLLRYLSQFRVGVLLQPDVEFDGDLFSVRLRRLAETPPVGRGYFVLRQRQHLFHAAML